MTVSDIKIKRLQPEKSRNMFEQIQKMKKSRATPPSHLPPLKRPVHSHVTCCKTSGLTPGAHRRSDSCSQNLSGPCLWAVPPSLREAGGQEVDLCSALPNDSWIVKIVWPNKFTLKIESVQKKYITITLKIFNKINSLLKL